MITAASPSKDSKCASAAGDEVKVISAHHSEIMLDQTKTADSVLQSFAMSANERVLGFRRGGTRLSQTAEAPPTTDNSRYGHYQVLK